MNLDDAKIKQLVDYWVKASTEDLQGAQEIIEKTSRYASGLSERRPVLQPYRRTL